MSARLILMHSYLTDEGLWPRKLYGQKACPRDSCLLGYSILIVMGNCQAPFACQEARRPALNKGTGGG